MELVQPIRQLKSLETMKKVLKASNLRDYTLFVLGINSGLRISDLLTLQVSDVLDDKGKIKDRIVIREKKTNKVKDFPIGESTRKALKEYLHTSKPEQALFPSRKGNKPITRQQAYRVLNDAARSIGITEQIGTHTMRKTFGYHAFQSGVDITRIMQMLNHSSPSVTLAYIGITRGELDKVYLDLNL